VQSSFLIGRRAWTGATMMCRATQTSDTIPLRYLDRAGLVRSRSRAPARGSGIGYRGRSALRRMSRKRKLVRILLLIEARAAVVVNGKISLSAGDEPTKESSAELASRSKVLRGALVRFFQRHVHDLSEIDDLIQEVFLRIVRRGDTEQLEKLDGYIFQTASSVLKDRGRRRKARSSDHHIPFDSERHDGAEIGPEQILIGQESLQAAGVILLELPERTRRVFILRRLEGLPYQEIGQRLGLSVSAVEKHMQRAVRHLVTRTRGNP